MSPKILIEIEARHIGKEKAMQTFSFLESLGYKWFFIYGIKQLPLSEFDFSVHRNFSDKKNYCNNFVFE